MIIDYLDLHYPGPVRFNPAEPEARGRHLLGAVFDLYHPGAHAKVVGERLRPKGHRDSYGVGRRVRCLKTALAMVDARVAARTWGRTMRSAWRLCGGAGLVLCGQSTPIAEDFPNPPLIWTAEARPTLRGCASRLSPGSSFSRKKK